MFKTYNSSENVYKNGKYVQALQNTYIMTLQSTKNFKWIMMQNAVTLSGKE